MNQIDVLLHHMAEVRLGLHFKNISPLPPMMLVQHCLESPRHGAHYPTEYLVFTFEVIIGVAQPQPGTLCNIAHGGLQETFLLKHLL